MVRRIILILMVSISLSSFAFAQLLPYLSVRKSSRGIMLGTEIINLKTLSSLSPKNYIYEWIVPSISSLKQTTYLNTLFISLEKEMPRFISVDLNTQRILGKEKYNFRVSQEVPLPKVEIVRKSGGFVLPLAGKVETGDYLTVITKNFSSKNLRYLWEFNGVFVSNEKEIPAFLLREKTGLLTVKVFGEFLNESASDFKNIFFKQ